jgi:pilus assembly protein Flp/PilA
MARSPDQTRVRPIESFNSPVFKTELDMKNLLARFMRDESGATAIEYALIAAGIGIAIITAVNTLGSNIATKFTSIGTALN